MVGRLITLILSMCMHWSNDSRLHVSQDRNEIYITIAEYGQNYLHYLKNTLRRGQDPGFLTMRQFGPWNTETLTDMTRLGPILLAIALRAKSVASA